MEKLPTDAHRTEPLVPGPGESQGRAGAFLNDASFPAFMPGRRRSSAGIPAVQPFPSRSELRFRSDVPGKGMAGGRGAGRAGAHHRARARGAEPSGRGAVRRPRASLAPRCLSGRRQALRWQALRLRQPAAGRHQSRAHRGSEAGQEGGAPQGRRSVLVRARCGGSRSPGGRWHSFRGGARCSLAGGSRGLRRHVAHASRSVVEHHVHHRKRQGRQGVVARRGRSSRPRRTPSAC